VHDRFLVFTQLRNWARLIDATLLDQERPW
jgi:hypothetical protein